MLRALNRLAFRHYKLKRPPSKPVAIVIPLSNRAELTPDEEISLRHLYHYLGHYDRFFLAPEGQPLRFPESEVKRFPRKYFGSVGAHARMLYWTKFYKTFSDYKFIFFYHLDSLAFSDQLLEWTKLDLDYIGPPWLNCKDTPWVTKSRVGNCGFALLRVEAALQILYNRYREKPAAFWLDQVSHNGSHLSPVLRLLELLAKWFPRSKVINRPLEEWRQMQNPGPHRRATDIFFSDQAIRFLPSFRIATVEQGLRFAFEAAPSMCFELNNRRMPFGCHAWGRYDRKFWEPHLLPEPDRSIPVSTPGKSTSVV